MSAITITPQGHLVLQKDIPDHLGVGIGNTVVIEKLPEGRIELRAASDPSDISQAFGLLKQYGSKPLTIEQIAAAAEDGWAGKR